MPLLFLFSNYVPLINTSTDNFPFAQFTVFNKKKTKYQQRSKRLQNVMQYNVTFFSDNYTRINMLSRKCI